MGKEPNATIRNRGSSCLAYTLALEYAYKCIMESDEIRQISESLGLPIGPDQVLESKVGSVLYDDTGDYGKALIIVFGVGEVMLTVKKPINYALSWLEDMLSPSSTPPPPVL